MKSLNSTVELWNAEDLEIREEYGCFCLKVKGCFCFKICFNICLGITRG